MLINWLGLKGFKMFDLVMVKISMTWPLKNLGEI